MIFENRIVERHAAARLSAETARCNTVLHEHRQTSSTEDWWADADWEDIFVPEGYDSPSQKLWRVVVWIVALAALAWILWGCRTSTAVPSASYTPAESIPSCPDGSNAHFDGMHAGVELWRCS